MINALFILNPKGEVLISKLFKEGLKGNISDIFRIQVISNFDIRSPILTLGSTTFLHIRLKDLWLVVVTRSNTDAGVIFEFLYGFKNLLINYFGTSINEETIKEYFFTIYDLLDEVLDYGYPQSLDFNALKQIVIPVVDVKKQPTSLIRPDLHQRNSSNNSQRQHYDLASEVPWRKTGIKYRKNELYLDIFEKLNVLISQDGKIMRSYVDGHIEMKSHLSGMPSCKFGLNDSLSLSNDEFADALAEYDVKNKKAIPKAAAGSVLLEDCKFHQCVQLDKFDSDRLIEFIPPDGEFQLMTYRSSEHLNLPFRLTPLISGNGSTKFLRLSLKSLFPNKLNATNVVVKIPVHSSTIDVQFGSSGGKPKFSTKDGAIYWKFSKFPGLTEHSLTAEIKLAKPSGNTNDENNDDDELSNHYNKNRKNVLTNGFGSSSISGSRPPIILDFELLMFSSSGLVVRFLKIQEKSNYKITKWVRYISQGGSYEVRY